MAVYVIGDVHGCYQTLMTLLDKINFAVKQDTLYFVGDLVGRGPSPREVVNFVVQTDSAYTCYGNHDLWAMACAYGCQNSANDPTLNNLFDDSSGKKLLDQWRLQSQMMILDQAHKVCVVHAGIPPCWSIHQAYQHAQSIEAYLHCDQFKEMLLHMEGDEPYCWHKAGNDIERLRYGINAFTRMRFCDAHGCLDFREKNISKSNYAHLKPWSEWPSELGGFQLFYGHWAALNGASDLDKIIATDTGCVYGGYLCAINIANPSGMILQKKCDK